MARPRAFDENQVLDAIMETFWEHGFESTSAQHLVDATGLGRGSLYNAYKDKEGLFEQALQRYARQTAANVAILDGVGSTKEKIRVLLTSAIGPSAGTAKGCLATNSAIEARGDPRVAALVRRNFDALAKGFEQAIAAAQKGGELAAAHDARALAVFLLNTLQGLRVIAAVTPPDERSRLEGIIETALSILG